MKWVYTFFIVGIVVLVAIFGFQNLQTVEVTYFAMSFELPVFLMAVGIYVLGMLTGSFVTAMMRRIVHGATAKEAQQ
jgi:uncharacterized integral membrane protein